VSCSAPLSSNLSSWGYLGSPTLTAVIKTSKL